MLDNIGFLTHKTLYQVITSSFVTGERQTKISQTTHYPKQTKKGQGINTYIIQSWRKHKTCQIQNHSPRQYFPVFFSILTFLIIEFQLCVFLNIWADHIFRFFRMPMSFATYLAFFSH